jgi:hypothetical protein
VHRPSDDTEIVPAATGTSPVRATLFAIMGLLAALLLLGVALAHI